MNDRGARRDDNRDNAPFIRSVKNQRGNAAAGNPDSRSSRSLNGRMALSGFSCPALIWASASGCLDDHPFDFHGWIFLRFVA